MIQTCFFCYHLKPSFSLTTNAHEEPLLFGGYQPPETPLEME